MKIPFSLSTPSWDSWFKEDPSHALILWRGFTEHPRKTLSLAEWHEAGMRLAEYRAPFFSLQANSILPVIFELVFSSGSDEEDQLRQQILFEVLANASSAFPHTATKSLPNRMEWWGFIVQHFGNSVFWRSGPALPAFLAMLEKSAAALQRNPALKLFLHNNAAYWQYEKEGITDNAQYWYTKLIFWATFLNEQEGISQKKMGAHFFESNGAGKMPRLNELLHNLMPLSASPLAKSFALWRSMMGGELSESAAKVIKTGSSVVEDLCGESTSIVYSAWYSSSMEAGLRATIPLMRLLPVSKI